MENKKITVDGIEFSYIENLDGYFVSRCGQVYSEYSQKIMAQHTTYNGYKRIKLRQKKHYIHQLVVSAYIGQRPVGVGSKYHIDHIDANRANNHVDNLRIISRRDNVYKERNKLTGAHKTSAGKWMAQIRVDGWLQYLGTYETQKQAKARYNIARMLLDYHLK